LKSNLCFFKDYLNNNNSTPSLILPLKEREREERI